MKSDLLLVGRIIKEDVLQWVSLVWSLVYVLSGYCDTLLPPFQSQNNQTFDNRKGGSGKWGVGTVHCGMLGILLIAA